MTAAFVAGMYVFMPDQHGRLLPDFSSLTRQLQISAVNLPTPDSNPNPVISNTTAEIKKLDDGSLVVDKSLPPEMDKLNQELAQATVELKEKKAAIEQQASIPADGEAERIIQQANALIAKTEQQYGLDTSSEIESILSAKPAITDPELQQLEAKLDTVDQDISEIERRYRP